LLYLKKALDFKDSLNQKFLLLMSIASFVFNNTVISAGNIGLIDFFIREVTGLVAVEQKIKDRPLGLAQFR
jgi:hypothetical protein